MPFIGKTKRVLCVMIDDSCYSALLAERVATGEPMARIINNLLKQRYSLSTLLAFVPPVAKQPEQPVAPVKHRSNWIQQKPKMASEEKKPDSYGVL